MDIKKLKKLRLLILKKEAIEWWGSLPIQNLYDMSDSMVGYSWKYYPGGNGPYGLTDDEILNVYINEKKLIK